MKRGRDEKMMEPMFPRLHVNDAFKGGPRAPPRNKMALYEQLSIPSQRFHSHIRTKPPSSPATNLAAKSSQATSRHHYENQCCLSSDSSLAQIEQRKKQVEDDYRVPIFTHSSPSKGLDKSRSNECDRDSTSNRENKRRQAANVSADECTDDTSNSSPISKNWCLKAQAGPFMRNEPGENSVTTSHGDNSTVCLDNVATLGKRKSSSNSKNDFAPENQNYTHHSSNNTGCPEDVSCKSFQTRNLEKDDCISETSVLETESSVESITPDDVASLIGQKRFWKARRTIADQQRIFAIQLFELHKLVKVQKLVAASSHLLSEEATALLSKPAKSLPKKKPPSVSPFETTSNVSKQSAAVELPSSCKEATAGNAFEKADAVSASENSVQLSKCKPPTGTPPGPTTTSTGNNCGNPLYFNQLSGHQFLVPVMSPSEGLVYKPYPGPCFPGHGCGGCGSGGSNPNAGNFMPPVCGVPALPQCPVPFPPMGPYGYFPAYGMPVMNTAPSANPPKDQRNPPSYVPAEDSKAAGEAPKARHSEDAEVLASTASSPIEAVRSSRGSSATGPRGMFPFFSAYSSANATLPDSESSAHPRRPIKVVPHNSVSASESAARIFRSIQEERKQNDSI